MRPLESPERVETIQVGFLLPEQTSITAEQYRKLRSVLNVHYLANSLRTVLFTSLAPAEGKTTISLNVSGTLARGLDESVVLVDADLRRKGLTARLGLENAPGLSDVLLGKAKIETATILTDIEGLAVLPAGADTSNPAELVASSRMKNALEELKSLHEGAFIVIDSPPFLPASEVSALSQMADGVILVILADETRRDVVKRELELINQDKILGVVLNAAEFETSHHYHKYYRSYYGPSAK